ncbi:CusA/CzcA family heavy metal efflux RND transporter [Haliea sp.]|jgi:cobalt-zinc-cadmium resistance protein CzcA|uniref:efflux RND transporter permease subunit n=1 Tax=Haliea TaxID=475794 RepID=UPI000C4E2627|nr:CusA/CzcA family heavy metal efflux RND transporter [Haliea sp.]HBM82076.1 CusA/CzcA family heavy metal efflux RND transporter [Halieaceae bacterium]MAD63647.1 CusA/CzcA family heavy metal efflux RND transporter [Haliea sp.]MAY92008.1 CusA/CzcA family heavy metal efflux RND transporter [Haliea sp.]MBK41932.1 CusA/CzcA family heavy metal efflux RND transporter [Haliea sp.]MBP70060.1 CusA/CzcA family heavy metal efflux RND transporter [Haliea sp.]|tara:strand:- start:5 stop:3073 length:3069 start_codon:yes stop_codon:yes gene_type:complete
MLKQLVRFSLTQRLFVCVMALMLAGLGLRAWLNLPIDAYPDIAPTQVKVILKVPGMTAEEIEQRVTYPLETELLGIPRQAMLRSTTKYAITDITLDFVDGTDIYWARQQVNERLAGILDELPFTVEGGLAPMSTPLSEMFMFTIENPDLSLQDKRQLLEWEIRPALRTVAGVADVNVLGGYATTYQVTPHAVVLSELGLGIAELEAAIVAQNLNAGVGRMLLGNDVLVVRVEGQVHSLEALENIVVRSGPGGVYRLGDVADVAIGHLARYGAVTRNGEEAVQGLVIALRDSNTGAVVEGVKARLDELAQTLPAGTEINVFYDRARLISTAIGTISSALFQAILLVVAVLTVFLGNLRAALVVSMSLPLAALATFLLMSGTGLTANLMSLGGLVIAIGMLVDSSVVVVENTLSRLNQDTGLPRLHVVYRAAQEVALPVVSGTLIVIIVFSPLLTLSGLEGKLFTPVALTIVYAMLAALALSLTLIPVAASLMLGRQSAGMPRFMLRLQGAYESALERVLLRPRGMLFGIGALLAVSAVFLLLMGKTFMPVLDEGDLIVQLEKSPSISLPASVELDRQVGAALLAGVPEIRQIVTRTGSDELGLDPMGLNETDVFMELLPPDEWRFASKSQLEGEVRKVLEGFPGMNVGFTQPIQMRISEMLTGSTGDVTVKVYGEDLMQIANLMQGIARTIPKVEGAVDVQASVTEGGKFLNLEVKPELAAAHGLTVEGLSEYLRSQIEGTVISEVRQGKRRIPVTLAAGSQTVAVPATVADLAARSVALPDGSLATLGDVASLNYAEGPLLIERERGSRFGVVTVNVEGRDVVGFVEELREVLAAEVSLPAGYRLEYGGEFENQQRATRNLLLVVPVALVLILLILFATFGSMALAGIILGNIPFALMGGVISLFLSGEYLSVPASVGLIALLGVAVLNGVVMVSHFQQQRHLPGRLPARICAGASQRLRPVLMTATTAIFGLLPLVFASGPGAEVQRPLAIVVVGGLLTSTVTTLFLLPVLYQYREKRRRD